MKLTVVGAGKMAQAIIEGAHNAFELEVVARDPKALEAIGSTYNIQTTLLRDLYDIGGKNIILCVKPHALGELSPKFTGHANLLLSALAGTTLESLKNAIPAVHYVRIMPNLAATYGKSMTTLCGESGMKAEAMAICETFGKALWLGSEKEIDMATALSGSGPAFLALVAEAMCDGGVKVGLKRDDAMMLTRGLFEGFVPLFESMHPALLKDAVMSPGGTTAAGYGALEEGRVRDSFMKAIEKAFERAQKK